MQVKDKPGNSVARSEPNPTRKERGLEFRQSPTLAIELGLRHSPDKVSNLENSYQGIASFRQGVSLLYVGFEYTGGTRFESAGPSRIRQTFLIDQMCFELCSIQAEDFSRDLRSGDNSVVFAAQIGDTLH
jgi:hypothetical protein